MPRPSSPTRRGALAAFGGAALALAAGCDLDVSPSTRRPPSDAPEPDADVALLEATVRQLAEVELLVTRTRAVHPDAADRLDPWLALHAEHRRVLVDGAATGTPSSSPTPQDGAEAAPVVPRRARRAVAAVRKAEEAWAATLAAGAHAAASGSFARLLAVMSAGVGQHLAADAPEPPR